MKFSLKKKGVLVLEDGTVFYGRMISDHGNASGEICFNTGMTGYQEISTDPSYFGQLMVLTNAHIGNYGASEEDMESKSVKIAGLITKNFSYTFSRHRASGSMEEFLETNKITAISDIDTRALVHYIRKNGAMNAVISSNVDQIDALLAEVASVPSMDGLELASKVSTTEPYFYGDDSSPYKVAAIDIGIKRNILENLAKRGLYIKVFPYNTTIKEIEEWQPDGYFISNGPGDPKPLVEVTKLTQQIIERDKPLFGICLGHQVIAQANNISTYKMHHGHRGTNHPILNIETGKGEITSQNHGFAVDRNDALKNEDIIITHEHLNDQTVAGIRIKDKPVFSVQYHPEASPGPNDADYLFDQFVAEIKKSKEQEV